jgi:hypothetical protein
MCSYVLAEYITRLLEAQNALVVLQVVFDNPKTHADSLTKSTLKSRFGYSVSAPVLQRTGMKQSCRWEGDISSNNGSKFNARWGTNSSSDPPLVSRKSSGRLENTELAALVQAHENQRFQHDQKDTAHNESYLASRPVRRTKLSNSQLRDFGLSNIRDISCRKTRIDRCAKRAMLKGGAALADRWSITKSSSDSSLIYPKRSEANNAN